MAEKEYLYTEDEVRKMWERDRETQIQIALAKCLEAINRTEGKVIVSFSGGKDSTVTLYLMAAAWAITKHKEEPLKIVFSDTTNEFICVHGYIKSYLEYIENLFSIKTELHTVRAEKNYFEIAETVGLPFISKKTSRMIRDCKQTLRRLGLKYKDIEEYMPKHYTGKYYDEMLRSAEKLRELGFNDVVVLNLTKIRSDNGLGKRFLALKYRPILDNDEIELSEVCCQILKKDPMGEIEKELGGLLPVTGEMAADGRDRLEMYMRTGCNMFDGDHPKSKPLGPVTEQTVLWYIFTKKIPIMPAYGEVIFDEEKGEYRTTGEKRTGCKLCGFGLMYDKERFVRLNNLEPKIVQFAFTSKKNGGLGYREVCEFLNDRCGMKIAIPEVKEGYYEKRAKAYQEKQKERKDG